MERVTDGMYFIPGRDEIIPDSHVYILGESHSHDLSMVDVDLIGRGEEKLEQIERSGTGLKDIKRIILTHTHTHTHTHTTLAASKRSWLDLWTWRYGFTGLRRMANNVKNRRKERS